MTWDALDLDAGTVDVHATVVRLKGEGLVLRSATKSRAGLCTLVLPSWCVEMLRKRQEKHPSTATVFPAPMGSLRDPSNTASDLRRALDKAGFDWVTSHMFRKTVATLMDEGGLSFESGCGPAWPCEPVQDAGRLHGSEGGIDRRGAMLEALG